MRTLALTLALPATVLGCAMGGETSNTTTTTSAQTEAVQEAGRPPTPVRNTPDLDLTNAAVRHLPELGVLVFEVNVAGFAGRTVPEPAGQLDGAPVLGYVFPTSIDPADVGFGNVEGIVALAITSHPDFDDTPLFDENADRDYKNDGVVWHPHWVVLRGDDRVAGGLSVRQFEPGDESVTLPPTNPGMPMYMDSPGFGVVWNGGTLRVIVPEYRVSNKLAFKFDALAA